MSKATERVALKVSTISNTCANCYNETSNRIHVGSIEGFIFCSHDCALDAIKRHNQKKMQHYYATVQA